MNRNRLKAYAPKARRDFIRAVTDRAAVYGLTKKGNEPVVAQGDVGLIGGKPFSKDVVEKRKRLVERIEREGFEQVMEAVGYTWFNRFAAIRFMEVHGYLDHGYRVLSTTNHTNSTNERNGGLPEILGYAEHVDLPGVDRERVVELKLAGNRDEELYRMLLVGQCNALHRAMPFLFERIGDATELLLPENLLHSDSLIWRMVNEVPEEEWQEVEILGWLYQFYISEKKDQVIGKVVKGEDIPAATQLFTPNWIVKYMVQNTIGRMWLATYPESRIKELMEYYIEPAEQTPEVMEQIRAITPESLNPEEMTLADVACGSGHILVEGYDLFKAVYQERGYRAKDIPRLILEKNLYGLDIDDRAAQLAAFALMMKAREDDRRIFDRGVRLNVMAIQNSPVMDDAALEVFLTTNHTNSTNNGNEEKDVFVGVGDLRGLLELFVHGKTFGSLIRVPDELGAKLPLIEKKVEGVLQSGTMFEKATARALKPIVDQANILNDEFHCVVTNPPYMSNGYLDSLLKDFTIREYPLGKSDLYGCFILRNLGFSKKYGFVSMITIPNWMFLWSFERLRYEMIHNHTIDNLVHNGRGVWGSDFGSCSFTIRKGFVKNYKGAYKRLFDIQGSVSSLSELESRFFEKQNYTACSNDFERIPGSPIAYWASHKVVSIFNKIQPLGKVAFSEGPCKTGNDDKYLRFFWEVDLTKVGSTKDWCLCSKGGGFRKYFGNLEHVISWKLSSREHYRRDRISRITPEKMWNERGITWTIVSAKKDGNFRELPRDCQFNSVSPTIFLKQYDEKCFLNVLNFLNSFVPSYLFSYLNPTLALNVSNILSVPFDFSLINLPTERCEKIIEIARRDWENIETSLSFQGLPDSGLGFVGKNRPNFGVRLRDFNKLSLPERQNL